MHGPLNVKYGIPYAIYKSLTSLKIISITL